MIWPRKCCVDAAKGAPPAAASQQPGAERGTRYRHVFVKHSFHSTHKSALPGHPAPPAGAPAQTQRFVMTFLQEKLYTTVIFCVGAFELCCLSKSELMYLFCKPLDTGYLDTLKWEGLKVIDDIRRTETNHVSRARRNSTHLSQSMNHL